MPSNIDEFLWPNAYMLTYNGFWPLKPNIHVALRYFNSFRMVLSIILTTTVVVSQSFEIFNKWGNLEILTEVGCITLFLGLAAFKECYVMGRHIQFEKMYWLLRDLWKLTRNREEKEGLENCAWQAKFSTVLFWVVGFSTYLLYMAPPIYVWNINKRRSNGSDYERHSLLNCRYWFDTSPTPIFEITFVWEAIALFSSGQVVVGLDGSMMAMIMHVVGQFRLINIRLKDIGCTVRNGSSFTKFVLTAEIKNCVKHHQRVISIAEKVNTLIGPLILSQFMIAAIEICLNSYAVMNGSRHTIHLIKYMLLLAAATVQLIIYCWPGEMLIQESTRVAETICYEIPWFALPCDQQRDLCLVIVRSQRANQITALGLQIMSLRKLTEVFNAAGSYMALLRSMNEKQGMSP